MVLVDLSQLLTATISLAIVFLPVELWVLTQVRPIRQKVDALLDNPEQRTKFIHEVAQQLWEPLSTTDRRQALLAELWLPIAQPESRQKLISELGHGLVRVLKENEGSLKGIATRQLKSEAVEFLKGGGGAAALSMLPGKFDLPVVGKVTAAEGLQIFQALMGFARGGSPGQMMLPQQGGSTSGYPR